MSEEAFDCHGESITAIEARELWLRTGVYNEPFRCIFCDIDLLGKAIAGLEFSVSPHFSRGSLFHADWCPDGPLKTTQYRRKSPRTKIYENLVFLPTKLVERRPARVKLTRALPSGDADKDRIERLGNYGRLATIDNHATTTLVATAAEAWLIARRVLFDYANNKRTPKLLGADAFNFVNANLKDFPLNLYGVQRNYSSAFHAFKSSWSGAAVHYEKGVVERSGATFLLRSGTSSAKSKQPFEGCVQIRTDLMPANAATDRLVIELSDSSDNQKEVQWFAYGELAIQTRDDKVIGNMEVTDSAHFYIR